LISGIVIIFGIIVFIYNKKIKYKKIKKIKELEEKIARKHNEIESLKQKISQIELKENNNRYNNELKQLELRLNEPWIYL
jgi:cell division protein FtsL